LPKLHLKNRVSTNDAFFIKIKDRKLVDHGLSLKAYMNFF